MTTNVTEVIQSWEEQDLLNLSVNGTTPTIVTSPVYNSGASLRMNVSASYSNINFGGQAQKKNISGYFRFASLPSTDIYMFSVAQVSGTTNFRGLRFDSASGQLKAFAKDGTATDNDTPKGPVIATNTWYYFTWIFDYPATNTMTWSIGVAGSSVTEYSYAHPSKTGGALGTIILGNHSSGPTGTYDLYFGPIFSCHYISGSGRYPEYPIPQFSTKTLNPVAEGTHVNPAYFTDSGGNSPPVSPHLKIDDVPKSSSDTDYIKQTTLDGNSYLEYEMDTIPSNAASVLGINIWSGIIVESASSAQLKIKLYMDGTERTVASTSRSSVTKDYDHWYTASYSPNPSVSGVNSMLLRHGYDTDLSPQLRIHDLWVNVAYAPTGTTSVAYEVDANISSTTGEPATQYSYRTVAPAKFKIINWYPFEYLRNKKLNDQADNQPYLYLNKIDAIITNIENTGDRNKGTPGKLRNNISIYAEYRDISTSKQDDGDERFQKRIVLPTGMFEESAIPIIFGKVGYESNSIKKINDIIQGPGPDEFTYKAYSLGSDFEENMDYFANILVVGVSNMDANPYSYKTVNWGTSEEKVRLLSSNLNQMSYNSRWLNRARPAGFMRNVSFDEKEPSEKVPYLNDKVICYAGYEEFKPDNDTFNESDKTDEDAPKSFTRKIYFPDNMFHPETQIIVIPSVGAKIVADPGTEIRKISGILRKVRKNYFIIEIREYSPQQSFETDQVYFCSFVAFGEALNNE